MAVDVDVGLERVGQKHRPAVHLRHLTVIKHHQPTHTAVSHCYLTEAAGGGGPTCEHDGNRIEMHSASNFLGRPDDGKNFRPEDIEKI